VSSQTSPVTQHMLVTYSASSCKDSKAICRDVYSSDLEPLCCASNKTCLKSWLILLLLLASCVCF